MGAIAEGAGPVLDTEMARRVGMTGETLDATVERGDGLPRLVETCRDGRARIDVRGRMVSVVDDGLATR